MNICEVHDVISFDKCIPLWNHRHAQGNKDIHHPPKVTLLRTFPDCSLRQPVIFFLLLQISLYFLAFYVNQIDYLGLYNMYLCVCVCMWLVGFSWIPFIGLRKLPFYSYDTENFYEESMLCFVKCLFSIFWNYFF